jgi:hypothetical protein
LADDKLDTEIQELQNKLQERNAEAVKQMEKDFRKMCSKDTAGTLLRITTELRAALEGIQTQLDAAFPIGALARATDEIASRLASLDQRITLIEKKLEAEA